MAEVFGHTSRGESVSWHEVENRWITLIRRGFALSRLEKAIQGMNASELSTSIRQAWVEPGELLWQRPYGFCIAMAACERAVGKKSRVLILQQADASKTFAGPFLTPVAGLLDPAVLSDRVLPARARQELAQMVAETRGGLQQGSIVPR
jgi:hypothetical protein